MLWSASAVLLVLSCMLVANQMFVAWGGTPLGDSRGVRVLSLAVVALTAAVLLAAAVLDGVGPAGIPRRAAEVWRRHPPDLMVFALGAAVAAPVLSLYWPRLFTSADSGRLLASVSYVWRGNFAYLPETQESYLPYLVFGPSMQVGGLTAVKLVSIGMVMVLAGVIALITFRITGSTWGAVAGVVALLCIGETSERALWTPMYPLMLSLGYLGAWYAYRAVVDPRRQWRYPIVAGICLGLSPEAHALGQLFVVTPLLVAVLAPTRRAAVVQTAKTYAAVAVVMLPRLGINLADGGLDAWVTTYRTDWWVTQGYVREVQENMWGYVGINEPLTTYLGRLPGRIYRALGHQAWLVVSLALAGTLCCPRRVRIFVLGVVAFMVLALCARQVPPFARYYSPVFPGMAILAGALVAFLLRHDLRSRRLVGAGLAALMLVGAVVTLDDVRDLAEERRAALAASPIDRMVATIDDDRGIIGARVHQTMYGNTTEIPTWGDQFLTEEEYVVYLTWPSDEEVLALLDRYDIGWAMIHAGRLYEDTYNDVWLVPHHGRRSRHITALAESPAFCQWFNERGYILYKREPCGANKDVTGGSASTG